MEDVALRAANFHGSAPTTLWILSRGCTNPILLMIILLFVRRYLHFTSSSCAPPELFNSIRALCRMERSEVREAQLIHFGTVVPCISISFNKQEATSHSLTVAEVSRGKWLRVATAWGGFRDVEYIYSKLERFIYSFFGRFMSGEGFGSFKIKLSRR